mmetsp:Transcript_14338/g.34046  ORF Transcript_14338/g.34046 Transcript_14338/m.34046 type:complete len:87 (-) Transcript_14338:87-347(-)
MVLLAGGKGGGIGIKELVSALGHCDATASGLRAAVFCASPDRRGDNSGEDTADVSEHGQGGSGEHPHVLTEPSTGSYARSANQSAE